MNKKVNSHRRVGGRGKIVRVMATNYKDKEDVKKAKVMEKYLNHQWKRYKDILIEIELARKYISNVYMIDIPDSVWNRIMEAVVKFDIKENLSKQP